jgi:uncharacterized protein YjbI with pentapeptide repeats
MTVQEQVERLTHSIDEWNQWRREQPDLRPDLSRAVLAGTNLTGANLNGADLTEAILAEANLTEANLFGAKLTRANLREANLFGANLREANLFGANLTEANLTEANLNRANLTKAKLAKANLFWANLTGAKFIRANLTGANLFWANLTGAKFRWTNLTGATLSGTNFTGAKLNWANLTEAHFLYTTFAWVDLSSVKGLETAIHDGPSTVNINSVTLPADEHIRKHFLRNTGFSDIFIDSLPSLLTKPIQYHSLFLSYSHQDQTLAKRLYHDLQKHGVRCWLTPHDLRPVTPIVRGLEYEKLLLIFSQHAINSPWLQQEVENALYKEVRHGQEILFPVRLDNTILESETLWAKRLQQRHIGNFTNWQDSEAYHQALTTLLEHLSVDRPATM